MTYKEDPTASIKRSDNLTIFRNVTLVRPYHQ